MDLFRLSRLRAELRGNLGNGGVGFDVFAGMHWGRDVFFRVSASDM